MSIINVETGAKKDIEALRKQSNDTSEKLAEKSRQYQKLQVCAEMHIYTLVQSTYFSTFLASKYSYLYGCVYYKAMYDGLRRKCIPASNLDPDYGATLSTGLTRKATFDLTTGDGLFHACLYSVFTFIIIVIDTLLIK